MTDFARFFFCTDVHLIFCCENSETGGFDFLASSFFSFLGQGIQSRIVSSAAADATVVPSGHGQVLPLKLKLVTCNLQVNQGCFSSGQNK